MKKKLILILTVLLVVATSLFAFGCSGDTTEKVRYTAYDFVYNEELGGLVVSVVNIGNVPTSTIAIPASTYFYRDSATADITEHDNPRVIVGIADNAFKGASLTSVALPSTIKSIGAGAFDGCTKLTSITFGADSNLSITIGDNAFRNCTELITFKTDGSTKISSVGNSAFFNCQDLREYNLEFAQDARIGEKAYFYTNSITAINLNPVAYVGKSAFEGWLDRQTLTLPSDTSAWDSEWKGETKVN